MRKFLLLLFLSLGFAAISLAQNSPSEIARQRIQQALEQENPILDLSGLGLTELPAEIADLNQVTIVLLGNNQFSTYPLILEQLPNLTLLDMSYNQLSQLPAEIGNLHKLEQLHLGSNELERLPPEIGNLMNLISLSLEFNQLSSVPPEITELRALQSLYLNSNQLSDLPVGFENLRSLCTLDLSSNLFSSPLNLAELNPRFATGGCRLIFMGNPITTSFINSNPTPSPAPAFFVTPTPLSMMIIDNTATFVPSAFPDSPSEPSLQAQNTTSSMIEAWQFERLILSTVALMGMVVSLILGIRLRRDSRKKKY